MLKVEIALGSWEMFT